MGGNYDPHKNNIPGPNGVARALDPIRLIFQARAPGGRDPIKMIFQAWAPGDRGPIKLIFGGPGRGLAPGMDLHHFPWLVEIH